TWWPRDTRAATEWEPTNPVPPVTSTLTGVLRAGPLALVRVVRLPAPAGSRTTGCHRHDISSYDSASIYSQSIYSARVRWQHGRRRPDDHRAAGQPGRHGHLHRAPVPDPGPAA